jgi:hypothetical protein
MKINFFKSDSPLFPHRWFIVFLIGLMTLMVYADLTGLRLFSFSNQQQWNASGPGYHK